MLRRPSLRLASAAAVLFALFAAGPAPVDAAGSGPMVTLGTYSQWSDTVGTTTMLHLVGDVVNNGDTATNIKVSFSLQAADGHEVGADFTYASARLLGIGERSPFEDVIPEPPGFDHYVPSVSAAPATATPAHQFSFSLDACGTLDPTSAACQSLVPQDQISGSVRNDNPVAVDNVEAIFTFVDAGGTVVARNAALVADGQSLAPGASGGFVIDRGPGEPAWTSMRFFGEPDYPIDLNPSSLDFGNQLVGTPSGPQVITLYNNGARTVSTVQMAPFPPGDFTQVNTCGNLVVAGSCAVTVTFTPSASGPRSSTLTITDDAAGTPQTIPLFGTGVAPLASFDKQQLDFNQVNVGGSAQQPVTLTNDGTAPLVVSSVNASGDYLADASACPASIDPQASCVITVLFAPRQPFVRDGDLTVAAAAPEGTHIIHLTGTGLGAGVGLAPTSVAFGNQSAGVSQDQSVTLTNTGNANLTVASIAPPAGITERDTCVSTPSAPVAAIPPNGSCIVTLTFSPQQAGNVNANVVVTDNAFDSPQLLPVSGTGVTPLRIDQPSLSFGSVLLGGTSPSQTVTLTNTGSVPIAINTVSTAGPFRVTAQTCIPALAVGAPCTITVQFVPNVAGPVNGQLTIDDTAAGHPHAVQLSGTGLSARWQSLGGLIPAGAAASSWGPSRVDVFVRGSDQYLWHQFFDGATWSNWERLGGPIGSDPAAVSWGPNHIDVFLKGTDGHPWQATYNNGAWSWTRMDGLLGSTPTVVSWAPGHLDLFTRGTDGQMWQNTFDSGRWFDWQPRGGVLDTEPAAVTPAVGVIDVFVKGTDNRLWQNDFSAGQWHNWQPFFDGILASVPAATSPATGRIDLFVRGTDSRLWHKTYVNGAWRNWTDADDVGGVITSKPGTVARGTTLEVFARWRDLALWWLELGTR